jgi:SAM-dependent methyltransferase
MKKLTLSRLGRRVLKRAIYSFTRLADPLLPVEVRLQGPWYFVNALCDLNDKFTGKREPGTPPRRLNISGGGSFRALGEHNLLLCRTHGQLQPDDAVLDVGCGIGRTALPLTKFLSPPGHYIGIDVIDSRFDGARRKSGNSILTSASCMRMCTTDTTIGAERLSQINIRFLQQQAVSRFAWRLPSLRTCCLIRPNNIWRKSGEF